jgi:hypothetical protein
MAASAAPGRWSFSTDDEGEMESIPGFLFFDHVAISVRPGELEAQKDR